jgi:hypothetical protein
MIRFLQQSETGQSDYVTVRHEWVDWTSLSELKAVARNRHNRSSARKR